MRMINQVGYFLLIPVAVAMFSFEARALPPNRQTSNNADSEIIKQVLIDYENKLTTVWKGYVISDICMADNYATVVLHDDYTGEEYILKKEAGKWKVMAADSAYDTDNLIHVGVPATTANKLLQTQNCINYEKS